jgi:phosphoribosylformylglycinamidine synthase
MLGLLDDVARTVSMAFRDEGDTVLLAGVRPSVDGLAGSEYLRTMRGVVAGKPRIDLQAEVALQRFLAAASQAGLLRSAHDVAVGGLAVTLAESCIAGGVGAAISGVADDVSLFAETQSCVALSCRADDAARVTELAQSHGVACTGIGRVSGSRLRIGDLDIAVADLNEAYESGLPHALEGVTANV